MVTLATVRDELAQLVDELDRHDDADGPRLLAEQLLEEVDRLLVAQAEPDVFGRRRALEERFAAQGRANTALRRQVAGLELARGDRERLLAVACELAGRTAGLSPTATLAAVVAVDDERERAYAELVQEARA